MREIGVRELKSGLSAALNDVAAGRPLTITRHGKPIAELVPPGSASADAHMQYLISTGKVQPATKPHGSPPPRFKPNTPDAGSREILEDRDQDR